MKAIFTIIFAMMLLTGYSQITHGTMGKLTKDTTALTSDTTRNTKPEREITEKTSPDYFGSLSFGYGSNHGGLGGKLLIGTNKGYGNSGLTMSAGSFKDEVLWEVGLQSGIKDFYGLLSYGGVGVYNETQIYTDNMGVTSLYSDKKILYGLNLTMGYLLNFYHDRYFIDLGAGYFISNKITVFSGTIFETEYQLKDIAFDIALGIRF